jgi:acyl carrier protein
MAESSSPAARIVRGIVQNRTPPSWRGREIPIDVRLGDGGLGLDSIALVELLLECEEAIGIPFPPDLFDPGPITLGRLIEHVRRAATT